MRLPSGEKATELTLDPTLSVSGSTAVGEGAVVKAVSLGACEPTGRGETDCSTGGLTKSGGVMADPTFARLDSFGVSTCFAGAGRCMATYHMTNADAATVNRIAVLQMTIFLKGRLLVADAVGSGTFRDPRERGVTSIALPMPVISRSA
jgi:hypothetical protein